MRILALNRKFLDLFGLLKEKPQSKQSSDVKWTAKPFWVIWLCITSAPYVNYLANTETILYFLH